MRSAAVLAAALHGAAALSFRHDGAPDQWGGVIDVKHSGVGAASSAPLEITVSGGTAHFTWAWDVDALGRRCSRESRAVTWSAGQSTTGIFVDSVAEDSAEGRWVLPDGTQAGRWTAARGVAAAESPCRTAADALEVCVVPGTQLLLSSTTCSSLGKVAQDSFDFAGMPGERESAQLVFVPPSGFAAANATVSVDLPGFSASVQQVGFVDCKKTTRYSPSGGGWHSDPLLPLAGDGVLIAPSITTPLWVSVDIPASAKAGEHTGSLTYTIGGAAKTVPIKVTVWAGALPSAREIHTSFGEIWSFTTGSLQTIYGDAHSNQTDYDFYKLMTSSLLPPDSLYKGAPYTDFNHYQYLADTGAVLLNLADIGSCTNFTPAQIKAKLDALAPTVEAMQKAGIVTGNRPYVYGYDEQPISCEPYIRALFGGFKDRWPNLTTAAVLNWKGGLPVDLPVDVWILQYQEYVAADAAKWKAAGKQQFWYHCIEPSGGSYLNTFIERPRTQGRLLYWLAAANDVNGWLYYATDLWKPGPGYKHTPIKRVNGTALTDFQPANYIWGPDRIIFANGDGQFLYPGLSEAGEPMPVSSARLELMRDAVEDQVLLSAALKKDRSAALALIKKLVRSPTDHTDDPALLETTRRALAALL